MFFLGHAALFSVPLVMAHSANEREGVLLPRDGRDGTF
jgi:hypothetical protein